MDENKTNINWLSCIYTVHQQNPYKMETFKKWDIASFNKKSKKWKNKLKIAYFWEELEYWLVALWHLFSNTFYMFFYAIKIMVSNQKIVILRWLKLMINILKIVI